jgi:S-disulfanyl-L-cysteine oxidoreductase SoxD
MKIWRISPSTPGSRSVVWVAGALVLSSVVAVFYLGLEWDQGVRIDPTNRAQVEQGKRIYMEACASCHGASLEGQPNWRKRLPNGRLPAPPHDASGHTWEHSYDALFKAVKYGPRVYPTGYQTDMPAFEDRLTDSEIAASLAFIASTWPGEIRAKRARMDARPQRLQ